MALARRTTPTRKADEASSQSSFNEVAWSAFVKKQERAHLLMGVVDAQEDSTGGRRMQLAMLKGLARVLCRRGQFAVTILRGAEGEDYAMIAVEHREDVLRVSRVLGGRIAAPFGPWLSHRSFSIDSAAYRKIAVALLPD